MDKKPKTRPTSMRLSGLFDLFNEGRRESDDLRNKRSESEKETVRPIERRKGLFSCRKKSASDSKVYEEQKSKIFFRQTSKSEAISPELQNSKSVLEIKSKEIQSETDVVLRQSLKKTTQDSSFSYRPKTRIDLIYPTGYDKSMEIKRSCQRKEFNQRIYIDQINREQFSDLSPTKKKAKLFSFPSRNREKSNKACSSVNSDLDRAEEWLHYPLLPDKDGNIEGKFKTTSNVRTRTHLNISRKDLIHNEDWLDGKTNLNEIRIYRNVNTIGTEESCDKVKKKSSGKEMQQNGHIPMSDKRQETETTIADDSRNNLSNILRILLMVFLRIISFIVTIIFKPFIWLKSLLLFVFHSIIVGIKTIERKITLFCSVLVFHIGLNKPNVSQEKRNQVVNLLDNNVDLSQDHIKVELEQKDNQTHKRATFCTANISSTPFTVHKNKRKWWKFICQFSKNDKNSNLRNEDVIKMEDLKTACDPLISEKDTRKVMQESLIQKDSEKVKHESNFLKSSLKPRYENEFDDENSSNRKMSNSPKGDFVQIVKNRNMSYTSEEQHFEVVNKQMSCANFLKRFIIKLALFSIMPFHVIYKVIENVSVFTELCVNTVFELMEFHTIYEILNSTAIHAEAILLILYGFMEILMIFTLLSFQFLMLKLCKLTFVIFSLLWWLVLLRLIRFKIYVANAICIIILSILCLPIGAISCIGHCICSLVKICEVCYTIIFRKLQFRNVLVHQVNINQSNRSQNEETLLKPNLSNEKKSRILEFITRPKRKFCEENDSTSEFYLCENVNETEIEKKSSTSDTCNIYIQAKSKSINDILDPSQNARKIINFTVSQYWNLIAPCFLVSKYIFTAFIYVFQGFFQVCKSICLRLVSKSSRECLSESIASDKDRKSTKLSRMNIFRQISKGVNKREIQQNKCIHLGKQQRKDMDIIKMKCHKGEDSCYKLHSKSELIGDFKDETASDLAAFPSVNSKGKFREFLVVFFQLQYVYTAAFWHKVNSAMSSLSRFILVGLVKMTPKILVKWSILLVCRYTPGVKNRHILLQILKDTPAQVTKILTLEYLKRVSISVMLTHAQMSLKDSPTKQIIRFVSNFWISIEKFFRKVFQRVFDFFRTIAKVLFKKNKLEKQQHKEKIFFKLKRTNEVDG